MWEGSGVNRYIDSNVSQFYTDFQIPFAGGRKNYDGLLNGVGSSAGLWSSSPVIGSDGAARRFTMSEYEAFADSDADRALGYSVRCFKDYSEITTFDKT